MSFNPLIDPDYPITHTTSQRLLLETMGLPKTYAVKKKIQLVLAFLSDIINSMFRRAIHIANPIIHQLMLDLPKRTNWDPPRDQRSKPSYHPLTLVCE